MPLSFYIIETATTQLSIVGFRRCCSLLWRGLIKAGKQEMRDAHNPIGPLRRCGLQALGWVDGALFGNNLSTPLNLYLPDPTVIDESFQPMQFA